jgi:hypothetical protein
MMKGYEPLNKYGAVRTESNTIKELTIIVPALPPNPNRSSRNWYASRKGLKGFAALVTGCAIDARNAIGFGRTMESATISISFVIPTSKRGPVPDVHNLLMGLKPAIDQLTARERGTGANRTAGIGIIKDDGDCLKWGAVEVVRRGDEEQTIITIRETSR